MHHSYLSLKHSSKSQHTLAFLQESILSADSCEEPSRSWMVFLEASSSSWNLLKASGIGIVPMAHEAQPGTRGVKDEIYH